MPATHINIPIISHNAINFNSDPEEIPAAEVIRTITYTVDDCAKIIDGILDELRSIVENDPYFINDEMLCILSRNDQVALNWYFATQERYQAFTITDVRGLTYATPYCRLRFAIGNVGDPVISQMPREV